MANTFFIGFEDFEQQLNDLLSGKDTHKTESCEESLKEEPEVKITNIERKPKVKEFTGLEKAVRDVFASYACLEYDTFEMLQDAANENEGIYFDVTTETPDCFQGTEIESMISQLRGVFKDVEYRIYVIYDSIYDGGAVRVSTSIAWYDTKLNMVGFSSESEY